ncbi:glycoside hydrolase family 16 protein [Lentisphaerota bacterium WC36G]|nr:glycoside hydrolase family 16 protein [Lentisphaerae bacterium WC36]
MKKFENQMKVFFLVLLATVLNGCTSSINIKYQDALSQNKADKNKQTHFNKKQKYIQEKSINKAKKKSGCHSYYENYNFSKVDIKKGYNWQLIWSDEFNEGGQPNPEKWTYAEGYRRNDAQSCYTLRPKNVRVENGCLVLEAHKEQYPNSNYKKGSKHKLEQQFAKYTSGRLKSENKFDFTYGKVDIRAKVKSGSGAWSQLSVINSKHDTLSWPYCGEMLMMAYTGQLQNSFVTTVFSGKSRWDCRVYGEKMDNDFNVWSMEWDECELRFYFNGELYQLIKKDEDLGKDLKYWPFDQQFCLYLDLIIGGRWSPVIDDKIFPVKMQVDYIRVYKDGNSKNKK